MIILCPTFKCVVLIEAAQLKVCGIVYSSFTFGVENALVSRFVSHLNVQRIKLSMLITPHSKVLCNSSKHLGLLFLFTLGCTWYTLESQKSNHGL